MHSSRNRCTADMAEPWSAPSTVDNPATNAAYGEARTDAATRTASVLVASSWSARRTSAVSIASTSAGVGRAVQAPVRRRAKRPVSGVALAVNAVGQASTTRRAAVAVSSSGWSPPSTVAAIVRRPIGPTCTDRSVDVTAARSSAWAPGHVIGSAGSAPENSSSATSSNECSARSDVSGYPRNSMPSSPSLVIADAIWTSIVGRGA